MIYQDQFVIHAPLAQVAAFIGDAQRILDYYPGGVCAQNIVIGQQLVCFSSMAASLLELDSTQSRPDFLVFNTYHCVTRKKSLTINQLKQQAIFTMCEQWQLQRVGNNTRVIKTWRQLQQKRWRFIPKALLSWVIVTTAKRERQPLIDCWNRAAGNTV